MRTVKTAAQLAALKGEAPDRTDILSRHVETMTDSMRKATEQYQAALLHSLKLLHSIAEQIKDPVQVTVQGAEKARRWEFTCEYDRDGRLVSIVANARG